MRGRLYIVGASLLLAGRQLAFSEPAISAAGLGIPESVASVTDSWGRDPQFILIQDIHRHPEAQNNISAMILYGLRHWGAKEIFIEGSWERGEALKKHTADIPFLLQAVRDGKMGGAEMAAAMAPDLDFRLLGLEDEAVYRQNVEAYQAAAEVRDEALRELETARLFGNAFDAPSTQSLNTVKRLIQLKLKPAEYAEYLKAPFHATSPHSRLALAVASAEHFYEIANERSGIFLERAKALHLSGPEILVVGGFHTAGMAEQLRREGISYVVLSPHVTQGGFEGLYAQGMHDTISALKLR